jgi:hypothetical protein
MKTTALRLPLLVSALLIAGAAQAQITIYKQPNFAGGDLTLRGDTANLGSSGFHDQASSLVVRSGRWEVCTQPDFKGDCLTLERGEYATLDPRINHRIESAREVTRVADNRGYGDRASGREGRGDREPAIALYSRPYFRGRAMTFDRTENSLEGTGFDRDRGTASVVVNEGTWQLCSDPGFEGMCRVYEPGRYGQTAQLYDQVASLRRVR